MLELISIKVSNQFFLSFSGDVPTNVIIGIGVGSAVLSMAGILMVTCVYIKKKRKKNGYNTTGMFSNVLTQIIFAKKNQFMEVGIHIYLLIWSL